MPTGWLTTAAKRLTPVPFDGAAFLMNLFIGTVGGMVLGGLFGLVLLKPFEGSTGALFFVLETQLFCVPAFIMGYIALRKFDQQSAVWTWAVGLAIWIVLVTINFVTFKGGYCGQTRWQDFWFGYIYPDPKLSCDGGLIWLFVTAPMLCNVAYALGAIVASRLDAA